MTDRISISQLARLSGRSKSTIRAMLNDGHLISEREEDGRQTCWIQRKSAVAAGLLDGEAGAAVLRDGTMEAAIRAIVRAELQPVLCQLNAFEQATELELVIEVLARVEIMVLELQARATAARPPNSSSPWRDRLLRLALKARRSPKQ